MLLWLFPGLPGFEAQDQAERDWQKDCEFDAYGSYGLSYEGFAISLIDLATACTVMRTMGDWEYMYSVLTSLCRTHRVVQLRRASISCRS